MKFRLYCYYALAASSKRLWTTVRERLRARLRRTAVLSRRRQQRRRSSLVRRFQTLLLAWGVLICCLSIAGFWFSTNNIIESTFEQQAVEWVSRIERESQAFFLSGQASSFEQLENTLKSYPEISYAKFYRATDGVLLAEYAAREIDTAILPKLSAEDFTSKSKVMLSSAYPRVSTLQLGDNLFRVIDTVKVNGLSAATQLQRQAMSGEVNSEWVAGYIDVGVSFASYKGKLTNNILLGCLLISFLFLLAAVVGRQLTTNALKPLLDLQEPLHRLAKGEMDVWVSRQGDEEIVAISRAINSTIRAIKGRDAELRRLADYDALTGLINKRSFDSLLEKERQRVLEDGDSSALFFIDLDQFKYVNDTLGHTAGDNLLIRIAGLLETRMRSDDVVCRIGGDEFAVLAKSVDRAGAIEIANGIIRAMHDFLFVEQGKVFNIYCSIGVAIIQDESYSADEIFAHADMACYTAKSQGRNRFTLFESDEADVCKVDIGWSHRIANALANDDFVLHYQPILSVGECDWVSFEVLLRMCGDDGEIIPPNMFIPVAERFGLATEIDYWVIRNSMQVLDDLRKAGKEARFYVNLSGQLLIDPDFVERVLKMFHKVNIKAEQIVFELTERAAVGNIHTASEKMLELRSHGFLFAVDDFGSGFSSYSYLKHMPVEFVKIEGEFVERIIDDEVDRAMVKSMVDVAKACGKQVVAEFVSNQRTLELLKTYGIDYAQGFFIASPTAAPSFGGIFRNDGQGGPVSDAVPLPTT